MEEIYLVLTFESVSYTIQAENKLKADGLQIRTIPTPREISSSCGISIRMSMDYLDAVISKIAAKEIHVKELWKYVQTEKKRIVEKIDEFQ